MNSSVCVDASFILRTLVPGPYSPQALALYTKWYAQRVLLVAPALLPFEVTAVLRRQVYLEQLLPEEGEAAFVAFRAIRIRLYSRSGLLSRAWELAKAFNRPRTYDMAYLAVAESLGVDFWTADERLYNAVKEKLLYVRWVGEL